MRLGAFLLIPAVLSAQTASGRRPLAWERQAPLAWQGVVTLPGVVPAPPPPSVGPVAVSLSGDGTLRVRDAMGLLRLRAGLPGRPLQAWRDAGVPLARPSGDWGFPEDGPLTRGESALKHPPADPRELLRGLLWILEDGEAFLSVVHPATAQVVHLPLPPGRDLRLRFTSEGLDLRAGDVEKGAPSAWTLGWKALLPRLVPLVPQPNTLRQGTALAPFPRD